MDITLLYNLPPPESSFSDDGSTKKIILNAQCLGYGGGSLNIRSGKRNDIQVGHLLVEPTITTSCKVSCDCSIQETCTCFLATRVQPSNYSESIFPSLVVAQSGVCERENERWLLLFPFQEKVPITLYCHSSIRRCGGWGRRRNNTENWDGCSQGIFSFSSRRRCLTALIMFTCTRLLFRTGVSISFFFYEGHAFHKV